MSTTYKITIINKSNSDKQFMLFQDVPLPSNAPKEEVFDNVYQSSPTISGDGTDEVDFSMTNEYFAIFGTNPSAELGHKVKVHTSSYKAARLGPNGDSFAITTNATNDPKWDSNNFTTTKAQGGFEIVLDNSFSYPNQDNIFVGMGARDPDDANKIIPIQTYIAHPGDTNQLFPTAMYYIATGTFEPGTALSRNQYSTVLQVDFTGSTINEASITMDAHGKYIPDPATTRNGVKINSSRVNQ